MGAGVCVKVQECVCISEDNFGCCFSDAVHQNLRQHFSFSYSLLSSLHCLVSQLLASSCPYIPGAGVISTQCGV